FSLSSVRQGSRVSSPDQPSPLVTECTTTSAPVAVSIPAASQPRIIGSRSAVMPTPRMVHRSSWFKLAAFTCTVVLAVWAWGFGLRTAFSSLQWVVDMYALALAALLLSAGTISERVGDRRVYVIGLVLFAAASLASGIAPNAGLLVVARGIQGIGGAAMFATTFALLNTAYQGR